MRFELGVYSFGTTPRTADGGFGLTAQAIRDVLEAVRLALEESGPKVATGPTVECCCLASPRASSRWAHSRKEVAGVLLSDGVPMTSGRTRGASNQRRWWLRFVYLAALAGGLTHVTGCSNLLRDWRRNPAVYGWGPADYETRRPGVFLPRARLTVADLESVPSVPRHRTSPSGHILVRGAPEPPPPGPPVLQQIDFEDPDGPRLTNPELKSERRRAQGTTSQADEVHAPSESKTSPGAPVLQKADTEEPN